jgi:hypothetical protein
MRWCSRALEIYLIAVVAVSLGVAVVWLDNPMYRSGMTWHSVGAPQQDDEAII